MSRSRTIVTVVALVLAWSQPWGWQAGEAFGQEKPAAAVSSPEALQLYRDAASFQNNKAFELAVEEWQKFLKNHPKDPLAAKAQHYLGVCQLQLKETEAAA